jgi:alkanesulfonate monooxygenase SsuD/methylene tetrahydromethanopterin reductase-like flavin-dependent oxidoreductase (luciferase family)
VKGRFVPNGTGDVTRLRQSAERAAAEWVDAVIVRSRDLGDPIVLAAGLVETIPRGLLGAALCLDEDGRHPSVLARDMTAFDHVCAGRALLCLMPPYDDGTVEAIEILRAMWRDGAAQSAGPRYPVPGAVNRPLPPGRHSPLLALDLTDTEDHTDAAASEPWASLVDLLVFGTGDSADGQCRLERTRAA